MGEVVFVSRFSCTPVAVTSTLKVQEAPPASVAAASVMLVLPETAVMVPPPQDPVKPFGVATTSPVGSVSVNPSAENAVVFGLLRVKVRAVIAPAPMLTAPNAFVRVSGWTTVRVAVPGVPSPALD
jgi:hypothetical protein